MRVSGPSMRSTVGMRRLWPVIAVIAAAIAVVAVALGLLAPGSRPSPPDSLERSSGAAASGVDPSAPAGPRTGAPIVIGHRGAAGYRPEHTLESYELAARQGADFIEPDLVVTKDGVLVTRHEPEIGDTTDIADHPELADRRTTKQVDGKSVSGWFTSDLTLAELQTLRAKERLPDLRPANTAYDGRFSVPTFEQVLALRERLTRELGRPIGVYPELKHPTFFAQLGMPLEPLVVAALRLHGLDRAAAPVFVQSFEPTALSTLRDRYAVKARLVLLTGPGAPYDLASQGDSRTYADLQSPSGLAALARTVNGIGPDKSLVLPRTDDGDLSDTPTSLVADAHRAGLLVHPYTFRAENEFLPDDYRLGDSPADRGRAVDEQVRYLQTGIDGLFTDQSDVTVEARAAFARTG